MGFAIDVSNFTGPFEPEYGKLVRDSNRRIIIGTQDPAIASQQAQASLENCLEVQLYVFQYMGVPTGREFDKTHLVLNGATFQQAPFIWLDFEDESTDSTLSPDVYLGWIERVVRKAGQEFGEKIGIYTRRGWWEKNTGNSLAFGDLPLWDANYDEVPDIHMWTPYGGWTMPAMKQYQSDFDLHGKSVDLNVF